ncbi:ATP-binding protein [Reyranella sp.]|uniref:sensor histidine kinase n=1 Tax=Reyranella sp. TaxID=1929291 RepID=UPI00273223B9|nr:ATP-binding protein [Reyranella sp.]MDP2374034.1 histidine kinase [Reyranella sp.]
MRRFALLGWAVLMLALMAIAAAPYVLSGPEPAGATVLDRATFLSGNSPAEEVSLPHVIYPGSGTPASVRYLVDIDLPAAFGEAPYLLVPLLNRRVSLEIAGETFYDSGLHTLWAGPMINTTTLVRLPSRGLAPGRNRLTLTIEAGRFIFPVYLSRLYFGTDAQLAPSFKWWSFVEQMKIMSLAAQVLLAAGLILAFFFRPHDILISWLAALEAVSTTVAIAMFTGFHPGLRAVLPYVVALVPAYGLLCAAVALALLGRRPPRVLQLLIIATVCFVLVCAVVGTPFSRMIGVMVSLFFLGVGLVAAIVVIGWGALRQGNIDARFMLGPAVLLTLFLARDGYIAATLPDYPFNMLSSHIGLVYVAAIVAVLMRRMASSFEQLDRSNETLAQRLAEREAELAVLARQEQVEASRLVREQERQRLTHDLHDGLSGHLVSIIAMSERAESKPIETAAREALNDLRLVIYSLDLGTSDLPLALANFRERLIPQLQRLGVELDWSMANLPEVSGVTPGNALAVLRILQEAITNALRHGPARRIAIRGSASDDGMAAIAIENDGRPTMTGSGGHGLNNMRRRAEQLQAGLHFEALDQGMRVTLLLPLCLPDVGT